MSVCIHSVEVWNTFVNSLVQQQVKVDGIVEKNPPVDWKTDDTKKVEYNLKARNILISTFVVTEYH